MIVGSNIAAIVNPVAGGEVDAAVDALRVAATTAPCVMRTTAPGEAADLAHELAAEADPPDVVVAIGGDGTVCEVVTGLQRARESGAVPPPLLVAPAGTGNSTFRGLWNDAPWPEVVHTALTGGAVVRTLDLARVEQNHHVVVLGSGSGLFAETLLARLGRPERGRELLLAASYAAMLNHTPYPGRVEVDGTTVHEGPIVETIVGGFRYRGGVLNLVPRSVVDDRLLDVTVIPGSVELAEFGRAVVDDALYELPGVAWGRGSRVSIERLDGEPLLWEHDGEVMDRAGAVCDLSVLPGALAVLTPAVAPPWFGDGDDRAR